VASAAGPFGSRLTKGHGQTQLRVYLQGYLGPVTKTAIATGGVCSMQYGLWAMGLTMGYGTTSQLKTEVFGSAQGGGGQI
jgi:hypothetical protein